MVGIRITSIVDSEKLLLDLGTVVSHVDASVVDMIAIGIVKDRAAHWTFSGLSKTWRLCGCRNAFVGNLAHDGANMLVVDGYAICCDGACCYD